jgi:hypothetical protein
LKAGRHGEFARKYIAFRIKHDIVVYVLSFIIVVVPYWVYRVSIYYVVGFIFISTIMEWILLKCPYCSRRFVKFWLQFPRKCCHCGAIYENGDA